MSLVHKDFNHKWWLCSTVVYPHKSVNPMYGIDAHKSSQIGKAGQNNAEIIGGFFFKQAFMVHIHISNK